MFRFYKNIYIFKSFKTENNEGMIGIVRLFKQFVLQLLKKKYRIYCLWPNIKKI